MSESKQAPTFLTTKEVAEVLRVKERKVYELAGNQEIPHVKLTGKLLFPKKEFYNWIGGAASRTPLAQAQTVRPNVVSGSNDPLLEWAIRQSACGLALQLDGSLSGLDSFESGHAMATGLHVLNVASGQFNIDAVQSRFAADNVVLVRWSTRQQGLVVKAGNPSNICSVADLKGLRIAQRQAGAGASILFEHSMRQVGLGASDIHITALCRTESESIAAVAGGQADAAPGLQAMAVQFGLGFVPTHTEQFDLLVCRKAWFDAPFQTLLNFTQTADFQAKARQLAGYSTDQIGQVVWSA